MAEKKTKKRKGITESGSLSQAVDDVGGGINDLASWLGNAMGGTNPGLNTGLTPTSGGATPSAAVGKPVSKGSSSSSAAANPAASTAAKPATPSAADPTANAATQLQQLISPLAMQLFFQQTIAPMLQQLGGDMKNTDNASAATMQHLLSDPSVHLPDAYRNVLAAQLPIQQHDNERMTQATQGAALSGGALDSLMSQLQQAQAAQRYDLYIREKQMANANSGGSSFSDPAALAASLGIKPPK